MVNEKKEFKKAEAEVVRFEKTDVITTSPVGCNPAIGTALVSAEPVSGGDNPFDGDGD